MTDRKKPMPPKMTEDEMRELVEGWHERRKASFERAMKDPRFRAIIHRKPPAALGE
jgi:hypothetical protein